MKHKKRAKIKKRSDKQGWVQKTHQWRKDIFVCTGYSAKEIIKAIKQQKAKHWMVEYVEKEEKTWQGIIDEGCAFVAREPTHNAFVMRLRPFQDSWEFWETLIHELAHLVDGMAEGQKFEKETEARAYLQEYLFHEIRRKLQGVVPYNSDDV